VRSRIPRELLSLTTRLPGDPTRFTERYARLDLETGEITDFGGRIGRLRLWPLAVVDEETLLAVHEYRRVVRLRRGSETMEVLFPRGADR